MTYQELINNIRSLGFSDDTEMAEFMEDGTTVLYDSINRAITELNLNVAPIIGKYEFELDNTDDGFYSINMTEIDQNFLDFADTPVLFEKDGTELYQRFLNYEIESGDMIFINAGENKGSFRIFYKKAHEPFDGTQLNEQLPLPLRVHHLVPVLASYYVWLDDDIARATQYFNEYEQKRNDSQVSSSENKIKIRILDGGI